MRKIFQNLLVVASLFIGSNVVQAQAHDHYIPYIELHYNSFKVGETGVVVGPNTETGQIRATSWGTPSDSLTLDTVNLKTGAEKKPTAYSNVQISHDSRNFIKTTPNQFDRGIDTYTAVVGDDAQSIVLSVSWKGLDAGSSATSSLFPTVKVTGKITGKEDIYLSPYYYQGSDSTLKIHPLETKQGDASIDNKRYFTPTHKDTTLYYIFNFQGGLELTGNIELIYPTGHFAGKQSAEFSETYSVTLTKNEDLYSSSILRFLKFAKTENAHDDQFEDLLQDFDPAKTGYSVELDKNQDYYLFFEPDLSNADYNVKVNGVEKTRKGGDEEFSGAIRRVKIPFKASNTVEVTVISPNKSSQTVYTLKTVSTLPEKAPGSDNKDLSEALHSRIYFTDGSKDENGNDVEYDVYRVFNSATKTTGKEDDAADAAVVSDTGSLSAAKAGALFDGFVYGKAGENGSYAPYNIDANTYKAGVPNPAASNLQLTAVLFSDKVYTWSSNNYRLFIDKTTGQGITWTVSVKKPKADLQGAPDPLNEAHWDPAYVTRRPLGGFVSGSNDSSKVTNHEKKDSIEVKYIIKLLSNNTEINPVEVRIDSLTGPALPLVLAKDLEGKEIANEYEVNAPIDPALKIVFATATPVDSKSTLRFEITGQNNAPDSLERVTRFANKNYENTWRTKGNYSTAASSWPTGVRKQLVAVVTSEYGTVRRYPVALTKDYNLLLRELTVKSGATTLFEEKDADVLAEKFDFSVNLPADFNTDEIPFLDGNAVLFDPTTKAIIRYVPGFTHTTLIRSTRGTLRYTVNFLQAKADTDLEYLTTIPAGLTPEFSKDVTEYTLPVAEDVSSVRVIGATSDQYASVVGFQAYSIVDRELEIPVTVTAGNKKDKKTYTILVQKPVETGLAAISSRTNAYSLNGELVVTSPVAERISIYSIDGKKIGDFNKVAGTKSIKLNSGIVIVKGSTGWVAKTIIK